MDLSVIDFEKQFDRHLKDWLNVNREKYKKPEELEAQVEKVYERWLNTPAPWLDGATPMNCFDRFNDAAQLVKWMLKYVSAGVWVPDSLLERITSLGPQAEELLLKLKRREMPLPAGDRGEEAVLLAIKLLNEMGSVLPMEEYIDAIANSPDNDYAESMAEALATMGSAVVDPILKQMEKPLDPQATEWFMSVLVEFPGDRRIYEKLLQAYKSPENDRAVLAAYLGKYQNADAIPILREALLDGVLNYLEWTETRNAIEELGGEANVPEPDFNGDPWYESLKYVDR